jgi:hypothetical protein
VDEFDSPVDDDHPVTWQHVRDHNGCARG